MPPSVSLKINATQEAYTELQLAYDYFNASLFAGELPGAMITLQRHGRSMGFYSSDRFVNRKHQIGDEIAMNPVYFATRPIEDTLSTLAHEMCHQWREHTGPSPSRRCYHDKLWAQKMQAIGLQPSSTGKPGGKEIGEKVSHYILPQGLFIQVCKAFLAQHQGIVWYDRYPTEGGKDYEYAASATVRAPKHLTPTDQEGRGVQPEGQGGAQSGASADPCVVDLPVFSPAPVDSGLAVAEVVAYRPRQTPGAGSSRPDASNRIKYSCPGCRVSVWGKANLNISCGCCKQTFRPV